MSVFYFKFVVERFISSEKEMKDLVVLIFLEVDEYFRIIIDIFFVYDYVVEDELNYESEENNYNNVV